MSDIFILFLFFIAGMVFGRWLMDMQLEQEEYGEDLQEDISKRIEQLEVEIVEQNGILYCWSKDPVDGYSFVGQAETRELLEQQFLEFARKKYAVS